LNNYSRNTFKLQTLNQSSAKSSQILTVDLPNNALVDLNTLTLSFDGWTSTTNAGANGFATFPRNIETLIERIEIEINGNLIGGCASYQHLFQIISDSSFGEDMCNRRKVLKNASDVVAPSANIASSAPVPFMIANWLGFLGSCKPEILDTNLLGNVRIRITLSSPSVLVSSTAVAATGADYQLDNMFFSVDTISIDDGNYYQMHDQFLAKGGVYEIPFNNYYSFSQTATSAGALKFSLSTQSLNMVWATFVNGSSGTPQSLNVNTNTSSFFRRSGSATAGSTSTALTAASANGNGLKYQFNINNVYYPNYQVTNSQAFQLMENAYGLSQDTLGGCYKGIQFLSSWNQHYWVAVQSFAHNTADDERFISGIDTRGNVAQCFFEYSGFGEAATCSTGLVFAQTSSILRVGAGRQIELVM
jgi:hypothetical protein